MEVAVHVIEEQTHPAFADGVVHHVVSQYTAAICQTIGKALAGRVHQYLCTAHSRGAQKEYSCRIGLPFTGDCIDHVNLGNLACLGVILQFFDQ